MNYIERLKEIAGLKKGWFDATTGEGERVTDVAINTALQILIEVERQKVSPPWLYPMPDGGVQIAWDNIEIDIDPTAEMELFEIDLSNGDYEDESLTTDSLQEALAWLFDKGPISAPLL